MKFFQKPRCQDGEALEKDREGNVHQSPYGNIVWRATDLSEAILAGYTVNSYGERVSKGRKEYRERLLTLQCKMHSHCDECGPRKYEFRYRHFRFDTTREPSTTPGLCRSHARAYFPLGIRRDSAGQIGRDFEPDTYHCANARVPATRMPMRVDQQWSIRAG